MSFTRRGFHRLLAASAAARFVPPVRGQSEPRKIGYCIVGLGRISMQHFMPGIKMSKFSRLAAIVSGHRDKAERMAAHYGIPQRSIYSYENYDAIRLPTPLIS